jgi:hypothetical protein
MFLLTVVLLTAQETSSVYRGSIPEELLRPKRGESPRYPIDTVIGELGQGEAPDEVYSFAHTVAAALLTGATTTPLDINHPDLSVLNSSLNLSLNLSSIENYLSVLSMIEPESYRLGGGKFALESTDNSSVSFLIRFIGREQGIIGELFIRYISPDINRADIDVNRDNIEVNQVDLDDLDPDSEPAPFIDIPDNNLIIKGGWVFDDLILEEARNRSEEQKEVLQRYDFSPYERFF